jgi:hypothetical protein
VLREPRPGRAHAEPRTATLNPPERLD